MTNDLFAILLVPPKGDPHGLLTQGPCGATPPLVTRHHIAERKHEAIRLGGCGCTECAVCGEDWPCTEAGVITSPGYVEWLPVQVAHWRWREERFIGAAGLVLAWEGAPVWQGMAWAHRCERARAGAAGESWPSYAGMHETLRVARYWQSVGLGTLVLLDANHNEVTL